jgi:hypothetical protein
MGTRSVHVDSPIQSPDKSRRRYAEGVTDSEECGHGNRAARFDLLPAPSSHPAQSGWYPIDNRQIEAYAPSRR